MYADPQDSLASLGSECDEATLLSKGGGDAVALQRPLRAAERVCEVSVVQAYASCEDGEDVICAGVRYQRGEVLTEDVSELCTGAVCKTHLFRCIKFTAHD